MKKLWSAIIKLRKLKVTESTVTRLNPIHIALLSASALTLLLINACSLETSSEQTAAIEAALAQKKQQDVANIEDNINNSYARLASNHADICPKLLQKDVDNNAIERSAEVMVDNHCDYFLYLRTGQHIAVNLNNNQIEALLIVPTLHNFADGDYQVASYDKQVIRLAYNGMAYKPERFTYDVAITVTD